MDRLSPSSARATLSLPWSQRTWVVVWGAIAVAMLTATRFLIVPLALLVAVSIAVYATALAWRGFTTHIAARSGVLAFAPSQVSATMLSGALPVITMLVPIRRERLAVVRQQAAAFERLSYPHHLLEIIVLVDEDDLETLAHAQGNMPSWVNVLPVPTASPRTKPRVLNHGLARAHGDIVGVWDGEDWPDAGQLDLVAHAFCHLPGDIVCLQGRLEFRHAGHNWLTRWAAIAYHGNFGLFIPALASLNLPVPLGGTTNFFRTAALRELGGWDAWNVTEDLDLGIRIARRGWKVRILDTVTSEESNPNLRNCINQWSRWEKGKIQTWVTHMRNPVSLWRDLGPAGFATFHLVVGVPILTMLLNPIFLLTTIVYLSNSVLLGNGLTTAGAGNGVTQFIGQLFPIGVLYVGAFCQLAGNAYFCWLAATGALHRKHYGLVPAALICVVHWLLLSVATYKGLWQVLTNRGHVWELTRHGYLDDTPAEALGANHP